MNDLKCPFCQNENTSRIPIEIIDSNIKEMWWIIIVCAILGVTIQPTVLIIAFTFLVLNIIQNIIKKISTRKYWFMQCPRCRREYKILNPYKSEKILADKQKKMEQCREKYAELNRSLEANGKLVEDEKLISEISSIGYHKNAFTTINYHVKITDRCILIYNNKGSFRIYNDDITSIKKKNYFLIIPTGICIKAHILNKKKKFLFVVSPNDREKIIEQLSHN
jgi:type IV secretory pathway VirB3-like protein